MISCVEIKVKLYVNKHIHQYMDIYEVIPQYKTIFCLAVMCDYNPCP